MLVLQPLLVFCCVLLCAQSVAGASASAGTLLCVALCPTSCWCFSHCWYFAVCCPLPNQLLPRACWADATALLQGTHLPADANIIAAATSRAAMVLLVSLQYLPHPPPTHHPCLADPLTGLQLQQKRNIQPSDYGIPLPHPDYLGTTATTIPTITASTTASTATASPNLPLRQGLMEPLRQPVRPLRRIPAFQRIRGTGQHVHTCLSIFLAGCRRCWGWLECWQRPLSSHA